MKATFFRNVDTRKQPPLSLPVGDGKGDIAALKARAVLIDMEESVVNSAFKGNFGDVFDPVFVHLYTILELRLQPTVTLLGGECGVAWMLVAGQARQVLECLVAVPPNYFKCSSTTSLDNGRNILVVSSGFPIYRYSPLNNCKSRYDDAILIQRQRVTAVSGSGNNWAVGHYRYESYEYRTNPTSTERIPMLVSNLYSGALLEGGVRGRWAVLTILF